MKMKMRRCEVGRCEDEKMRDRSPLLEEPCAQTHSGKKKADPLMAKKKIPHLPSMRMLQLVQARLHPEEESCARI